ncbi:MAG: alpha/beta fold hydrolase [Steroidobacteraceae bacterium]
MTIRSVCLCVVVALALLAPDLGAFAADSDSMNSLPAPIFTDPEPDPEHPASGLPVQFRSHGALLNGMVYRPPGAQANPTAIFFHGLPGNEENLDLAQVMRRAGWTVVTFHYTGAWGSGGRFTLRNGVDDAAALFAHLREPAIAQAWGVDPTRILVVGHSYGGYVAARAAGAQRGVIGAVLLAPWDISVDQRQWSRLPRAERRRVVAASFDDVDGRLAGADQNSLAAEILQYGAGMDLPSLVPALLQMPVLLITATIDDEDDKATDFLARMQQLNPPRFTSELMDTDHSFNGRRIELEAAVLRWTAAAGLAPASVGPPAAN